jgi:DNA-binding MarR family transcriptional regulator
VNVGHRTPANPRYRVGRIVRRHRSISLYRRNDTIDTTTRAAVVDDVIAGYEGFMHRLADSHAPEFLEIDITMPQAKLLYLLGAAGELHMSDLVARLGVSLSTISGLVDRVVDHGLATRREDPADRRQVVVGLTPEGDAFIDRFRELNARQMRDLLARLDDDELEQVRLGLAALARAAGPSPSPARPGAITPGGQAPRPVTGREPS